MNIRAPTGRPDDQKQIHPQLLRLALHFAALSKSKYMPARDRFHADDLHWLYGSFYTVDVLNGGADYRFGYCGPSWKMFYGIDLSGKRLSEVEYAPQLLRRRTDFDAIVAARRPGYSTGHLQWPDGYIIRYERLTIPFSGTDPATHDHATMLLVAAQCEIPAGDVIRYNIHGRPHVLDEDIAWPPFFQSHVHRPSTSMRSL